MSKNYYQRQSQEQEHRAAADLGARVQKASGAMAHAKSDARKVGELRIECKLTTAKSYNLKLSDLEKIALEAINGGIEEPILQVQFVKPGGMNRKYAVVDWHSYVQLREEVASLQERLAEKEGK